MTDDEVLYVEDCKHAGPDDLIVQRNNGVRWVTCVACGAEFVREEFLMASEAEGALDVLNAVRS